MILFPRIGREYWYVTDIWDVNIAVPVQVESRGGLFDYSNKTPALWRVRWVIVPPGDTSSDTGYYNEFDASRHELYRTHKQAARAAAKLNKKNEEAQL